MQGEVGGILFHALAGVDRSGRGCNPRPAWVFWTLLPCFRGGGSFRSGVQPPTGTRPTGSDRLWGGGAWEWQEGEEKNFLKGIANG